MSTYLVTWKIDMEANSHAEAAAKALIVQRDTDPANTATVFDVEETLAPGKRGPVIRVDLSELALNPTLTRGEAIRLIDDMMADLGQDDTGFADLLALARHWHKENPESTLLKGLLEQIEAVREPDPQAVAQCLREYVDYQCTGQPRDDEDTGLTDMERDSHDGSPIEPEPPTDEADEAVVEAALDAAVFHIQEHLGQGTGDFAGMYFSGGPEGDDIRDILLRYLRAERQNMAACETARLLNPKR